MTVVATATDRSARSLAKRALAKKGRSLVLRQRVRVEVETGPTAGSVATSPLSTRSLRAVGALAAGAALVSLDAAALTGLLVAGDRLVFAGHSQVYVVTGGPYAAAGNAVANVAITPALAANVADDEAVTASFTGTDKPIKGLVTRARQRMVDGTLTRVGDWDVLVAQLALDEAGIVPKRGDELFLGADVETAARATVVELEPVPSGELDAAVYLIASEG